MALTPETWAAMPNDRMSDAWLHFSDAHLLAVEERVQPPGSEPKPDGLWVSAGRAWMDWCKRESFRTHHYRCATRVHLAPDANVVRLTSADELQAFSSEFWGQEPVPWPQAVQEDVATHFEP